MDNKDDDIYFCVVDIDGYYIFIFLIEDYEKYFWLMLGWKVRNDDVIISVYLKVGRIFIFLYFIIDRFIKFIKCINFFKIE